MDSEMRNVVRFYFIFRGKTTRLSDPFEESLRLSLSEVRLHLADGGSSSSTHGGISFGRASRKFLGQIC